MTKPIETIDLATLHACTGGGDRAGIAKDLKMFFNAGGIPSGYGAGEQNRVIGDLYARRGF
jgi:hypothetical protein